MYADYIGNKFVDRQFVKKQIENKRIKTGADRTDNSIENQISQKRSINFHSVCFDSIISSISFNNKG